MKQHFVLACPRNRHARCREGAALMYKCVAQYSGNYACDEMQKLRYLLFCQQTFVSAFRADAFPRLDAGEHHPATQRTLASLKMPRYKAKWQ